MKEWFARVLDAIENNRPEERRRAPRKSIGPIRANYVSGGAERPFPVADVSLAGAFIESPPRWGVGTILVMLFQVDPPHEGAPLSTRALRVRISRSTPEGFGVQFLFQDKAQRLDFHRFLRQQEALEHENPGSPNSLETTHSK